MFPKVCSVNFHMSYFRMSCWPRESTGVESYSLQVYPTECGEQLGRDPSKNGSSESLVLKSLSGEGTLWDSSLLVALALWYTPVLCTPPLSIS